MQENRPAQPSGPATAPPRQPRQPQQQDRGPCPQTDPSPEHWAREHEAAWGCSQKGPPHARHSTDTSGGSHTRASGSQGNSPTCRAGTPDTEQAGLGRRLRQRGPSRPRGWHAACRAPASAGSCPNLTGHLAHPHRYPMVPVPLLLRSHRGLAVVTSSISQTPSKPTCFSPVMVTA